MNTAPSSLRFKMGAPLRERELAGAAFTEQEQIVPEQPSKDEEIEINLCLSGGGFRAALFHLGVLYYLHSVNRLKDVSRISSVSGGSILAAHFAMRLDNYLQSFKVNNNRAKKSAYEFVEFTKSDLRGRVIRRWFLSIVFVIGLFPALALLIWRFWPYREQVHDYWLPMVIFVCLLAGLLLYFRKRVGKFRDSWSRTGLLEWAYDRFYSQHLENSQSTLDTGLPDAEKLDLEIMSTSFSSGILVSFSKNGIRIHDEQSDTRHNTTYPLSKAITASSAFPAAFPPVYLSKTKDLQVDEGDTRFSDHHLGDGGIYDNLGICNMAQRLCDASCEKPTFLIVCDAGRPFQGDPPGKERSYSYIHTRATRSSDIQMNRLAILDNQDAQHLLQQDRSDLVFLECNISESVAGSDVEELESLIRIIRTDLNVFSAAEIHVLVRHGYHVAKKACAPHLGVPENEDNWSPLTTREKRKLKLDDTQNPNQALSTLKQQLEKSSITPFGILSWKDGWCALWTLVAFIPWALIIACLFYFPPLPVASLKSKIQNVYTVDSLHLSKSEVDYPDFGSNLENSSQSTFVKLIFDQKKPDSIYFEIPIIDYYDAKKVDMSLKYQETYLPFKVIAFHKTQNERHELLISRLSDNSKEVTIEVPPCRRGDKLVLFFILPPSELSKKVTTANFETLIEMR